MNTMMRFPYLLFVVLWLGLVPSVSAQSAPIRNELLTLLPDDFAICVVMHDLRSQVNRWEQSGWVKTFRKSLVGKTLLEAPELQQLAHWEKQLQKHFDLDWPSLRDDVLGDSVVFSYSPGPPNKPEDERGMLLVAARKPERLKPFIDKLNVPAQKTSVSQFKGITCYRVMGKKPQYFFIDGPLIAVSSREDVLHGIIDKKLLDAKDLRWMKRFQNTGMDQAFVTMCINPRTLTPEFLNDSRKYERLPGYWQALEGIFVSLSIQDDAELRVSIQANLDKLPSWTRQAFSETAVPSTLWQRFPDPSIVTLASKTDFSRTAEALMMLLPEKDRKHISVAALPALNALLGLDLFKDLLPNIGPDWGVCLLPTKNPQHLPQGLFAVAIKAGKKDPPIDQSLFKAMQTFAGLALVEYNKTHADAISLHTLKQDKIEVMYLSNSKIFPPGMQPACALKDGYLLFASSPEAIGNFRLHDNKSDARKDTLLLRLSTHELAKLLRGRQEPILENLRKRQLLSEKDAMHNLESAISFLELFDQLTVSHRAQAGQANWTFRITPAKPRNSSE